MATSAPRGLRSSSSRRIPRPPEAKTTLPSVAEVAEPAAIAVAGGELASLASVVRTCAACPRASEQRTYGSGYVRASVLFVKDAPSRRDLDAECAFVDEAAALERAMAALDLPPGWMYATTAVRCGDAVANADDAAICSRHLLVEIEAIGPRVVVACGDAALTSVRALDGRCGITVPADIERGTPAALRGGLTLIAAEPLPAGVTQQDAKRRFWKDLQALPGLLV